MVKHTQKIRWQEWTICLSVSDHLVGLALKGLILILQEIGKQVNMNHYVITFLKIFILK